MHMTRTLNWEASVLAMTNNDIKPALRKMTNEQLIDTAQAMFNNYVMSMGVGPDEDDRDMSQLPTVDLEAIARGLHAADIGFDTLAEDADVDDDIPVEPMPNEQRVLTELLADVFGMDVWDDGVHKTAARVLRFWREYCGRGEAIDFPITSFPAHGNQLVICKDIDFSSLCAHHLLPFYGKAHVGYIPNKLQVGISKIPRLVDFWAQRPQVQERLTEEIASSLKHTIDAMGVAVVIEARHTCMACRGVRKHNGLMITSNMRGVFLTAEAARSEFMRLIDRGAL